MQLKAKAPDIQVLVFTVFGDSDLVFKALEAGASGYLLKRTPRQEIVEAVKDVWFGGAPMSGEIARKVVDSFRKPSKAKDAELEQLTPREEEVLAFLAKGYITKEQLGFELKWGDAKGARRLLEMISHRQGFGAVLAEGSKRAAEKLGGPAKDCAIYIEKGATPRGHDHRARWDEMLDTATSNR